jgi:UDP-glucose 4-epimerase
MYEYKKKYFIVITVQLTASYRVFMDVILFTFYKIDINTDYMYFKDLLSHKISNVISVASMSRVCEDINLILFKIGN